jgi:cholesterol transport system auxiliary component
MKQSSILFGLCLSVTVSCLLEGCGLLSRKAVSQPAFYSLGNAAATPARNIPYEPSTAPTLLVTTPRAAAGYDSAHIVYLREPQKLEYFAHSEWIDTPARMLAPMIVTVIANGGTFAAVVPTSGVARGDLSLDTDILRLQQDFESTPSQVRFTLRATVVDNRTGRVLAWREFDQTVAATTDDPHGGVLAAALAVETALGQLTAFCKETAEHWQHSPAGIAAAVGGLAGH